jgi:hypothetical protein
MVLVMVHAMLLAMEAEATDMAAKNTVEVLVAIETVAVTMIVTEETLVDLILDETIIKINHPEVMKVGQ